MADPILICNQALSCLGQGGDAMIASLDDKNEYARACKLFYDSARREMLEAAPWRFALRISPLALLNEQRDSFYGYSYAYPSDCLLPLRLFSKEGIDYKTNSREGRFLIHLDSLKQRVISCNVPEVSLRYVADVTDVNIFPPLFIRALSLHLAVLISGRIADSNTGLSLYKLASEALIKAASHDAASSNEEFKADYSFINARRF